MDVTSIERPAHDARAKRRAKIEERAQAEAVKDRVEVARALGVEVRAPVAVARAQEVVVRAPVVEERVQAVVVRAPAEEVRVLVEVERAPVELARAEAGGCMGSFRKAFRLPQKA